MVEITLIRLASWLMDDLLNKKIYFDR